MLRKLYRSAQAAKLIVSAFDHASKAEYALALSRLEKVDAILRNGWRPHESEILKGAIYMKLERYRDAVQTLEAALCRLEQDATMPREVRKYMACYASVCARYSLTQLHDSVLWSRLARTLQVDYSDIDLNRVPRHVKRKLPLRDHPAWNERVP